MPSFVTVALQIKAVSSAGQVTLTSLFWIPGEEITVPSAACAIDRQQSVSDSVKYYISKGLTITIRFDTSLPETTQEPQMI